ncbi:hypothetical protein E3N88_22697 [Mikania micrantha]|uniref:Uncharacterized protein n=1 Tax=Mikania micrantha TaxID=192012 RepID=A0A5N6NB63_9ASTR|nr:hypothetical protein E3N88_22697 [Mikania micrantha]
MQVADLAGHVLSGRETILLKEIVDTVNNELDLKEVYALRSDVSELAASVEDQKKTMNKEGLPKEAATWEDKIQFLSSFPNLHLEDKVNFKGDGNVMNGTRLQPKNKEIMSPEEGKSQPKLRRSKRVKETNSKMRDYVCQATSATDN